MPLPAAEHAVVHRQTRDARNAGARRRRTAQAEAEHWCEMVGATWERWGHFEGVRYTLRVAGFHPVTAPTLPQAVVTLDRTLRRWCEGPATHGPTGASLARLRACLPREALRGD